MKEITEKALLLAKEYEQVIGRDGNYYVTIEQLDELLKQNEHPNLFGEK